ncbi:hypothetical protein VZT92_010846 [Zoarces viviparus]|uniref:Uncharacterized protein n=1 Tax=Zoarces viviparus TaxID=48416 RepID=A0AAW1F8Y1_ZOAVI
MQSTLIGTKVTPRNWPWRVPCTIDKVRHHKEDEKKGQQTSDLILEGGCMLPPPPTPCTFLWDLYFLPNTSCIHN